MNRTDRLYALVEELRARAPRRTSARELAALYEVSVRTVERDIAALQQASVPIYADVGRAGGYSLDTSRTLPPMNFTAAETVALAIALTRAGGSPYARAARTALQKVVAAMSDPDGAAARELAERIRFVVVPDARTPPSVPAMLEEAMSARRVVRLVYRDAAGAETSRDVEPVAFSSVSGLWYLTGWCRLRDAARIFRIDRVHRVALLEEAAPERNFDDLRIDPWTMVARPLELA